MTTVACTRVWILVAAMLAGTGCQREENVPEADPGATPTVSTNAAVTLPATAAESSLLLRRGTVMLTADLRELKFCGEAEAVWLVDQGDPTLDEVYAKLAGEPGTALYVEIRGERIDSPAGTAIPASFKQSFLLGELLYARMPGEGGACEAVAPAYRAQARGNEPFWSVEIGVEKMLLRQPGLPAPQQFSLEETLGVEGTVTYQGAGDGHSLQLTITSGACSDSMSGDYFAYTAEASLDGRMLNGCARLGE